MISFTITTPEGKQNVSAPASWNEINYAQLIRLETEWNGADVIQLFSILVGIEFSVAEGLSDPGIDETLYEVCGGIITGIKPNWKNLRSPKKILWDGRMITIPTDLRKETLAQKVMINGLINSDVTVLEAIPSAVAIYLQPQLYPGSEIGKKELIDEITKQVKERNALEVYAIGSFFFKKLKPYQQAMLRSSLLRNKTRLRKLRELKN